MQLHNVIIYPEYVPRESEYLLLILLIGAHAHATSVMIFLLEFVIKNFWRIYASIFDMQHNLTQILTRLANWISTIRAQSEKIKGILFKSMQLAQRI